MALTPKEKEARKAARLAKLAEENERKHEEFLAERESFRNAAPRKALELLARADKLPGVFIHTKVTRDEFPNGDNPARGYYLVQLWTGDEDLEVDLYVWDRAAETPEELNNLRWELERAVLEFERYEEEVNGERERERKRRELLGRLSAEERELLGV